MSKENIGFGLAGISFTDLDYVTFYWIWTGNLLDCDFELHLLDTTGLRLKTLSKPEGFSTDLCIFWCVEFKNTIHFLWSGQVFKI